MRRRGPELGAQAKLGGSQTYDARGFQVYNTNESAVSCPETGTLLRVPPSTDVNDPAGRKEPPLTPPKSFCLPLGERNGIRFVI